MYDKSLPFTWSGTKLSWARHCVAAKKLNAAVKICGAAPVVAEAFWILKRQRFLYYYKFILQ